MLRDRIVLLAKIESTYGTDATPVAASDSILCSVPEFQPIGRQLDRQNAIATMGRPVPINIGEGLNIKFSTELKGDGSAPDTPPEIAPLFRACNFTETINVATDVVYAPNSSFGIEDSAESLTIYYHQDGIRHILLGARGTFSLELKAGEYGVIHWDFTGLYGGPTTQTLPTLVPNTTLPPRFKNASFTIDSYAAIIENMSIDIANEVVMRPDVNAATGIKEWLITDREPKGEVDPDVPAIATKDFWAMWQDTDAVALAATVGEVANNKCAIAAPKLVLDVPSYGDRQKILTHGLPFSLHPDSGNDEITFTFS